MTPSSERLAAPEIDSVAFTTAVAAYQRNRRLLESARTERADAADVMHETRIARARLRHVIARVVADAVEADVPKSTLVRRMNDRVNALVRTAEIEPDVSLVSELIDWIVEGYPDDVTIERAARGRPTPARGRDVIPIHFAPPTERAG